MPSWKTPTNQQVDEVVRRLIESGHYSYFFSRLENPEWIEPLLKRKFFRSPPPVTTDAESGQISMPRWPESSYLARMAAVAPEKVMDVLKTMSPTENGLVLEDLTDALIAMPEGLAAGMATKAAQWAQVPYRNLLRDKLGQLMSRFAQAGLVKEALTLARAVLKVPSDDSTARNTMEEWEHSEILKKYYPAVISAAPLEGLSLLCNLLRNFRRSGTEAAETSVFWRPAIEEHDQNHGHSIADHFVDAIVAAISEIVIAKPESLADVLKILRKHPQRLFLRIELHTLQHFGALAEAETAARLTDKSLFEDAIVRHEYAGLLRSQFQSLPEEARGQIVQWIKEGPDVDDYIEWYRGNSTGDPSEEQIDAFQGVWRRDKIAWFADVAPEELQHLYGSLVDKHGEPEHPDFSFYSTTSWGPTSPKSQDQLKEMSPDEVIAYLKDWRGGDSWRGPTEEGLGRVLESLVSNNPEALAARAHDFRDLPPAYANHLLNGLTQTKWESRSWSWEPVFQLLEKVAGDQSDDWRPAKMAASRLLDRAIGGNGIEFDSRKTVWSLIEMLTSDPDPTPNDGDDWGRSEPWTQAINTVRGEAMHAAMQYGLWCRRELDIADDQNTFDQVPELRTLLDAHLDLARDPAPAIRSVYGQFYPWLHLMDRKWALDNVKEIFPTQPDREQHWYAAWGSYVLFDPPYDNVFETLREQYLHACNGLTEIRPEWQSRDVDEPLANHLMTFFWRGKLENEFGANLLKTFWEKARPETRVDAIRFLGRSLSAAGIELSAEQQNRFMKLWETRLGEEASSSAEELATFGHWFTSKQFPTEWSIEMLTSTIDKAGTIRDLEDILEQMPHYAAVHPRQTARLLLRLVSDNNQPWAFDYREGETKQALEIVISSADSEAEEVGRQCVNLLAARGHLGYRSVIKKEAAES